MNDHPPLPQLESVLLRAAATDRTGSAVGADVVLILAVSCTGRFGEDGGAALNADAQAANTRVSHAWSTLTCDGILVVAVADIGVDGFVLLQDGAVILLQGGAGEPGRLLDNAVARAAQEPGCAASACGGDRGHGRARQQSA
jgi:hypothetical protein